MKNKILSSLALKNIKANRLLQIPYILATGIMSAMFYIMLSLIHNEYVQSRHASLPAMMEFGVLITGIVLIIFSLYANRFLMGRRNKELALYGVMGLEKKHIARVLLIGQFISFVAITVIAILGGFLIGKLVFWSSNILLQDKNISFDKYPLDFTAIRGTLKIILINMTLSYLLNILKVRLSDPIRLMNEQFAGEREPKVNWIFLIIGLSCMGIGYYIALTVEGSLASLMYFFAAILFVMVGTYGSFVSLSVAVLKMLKNNKQYYYRTSRFISTSGMLYRMKSNAVGLASICILCSGIIVVLAVTLTIYSGVGDQVDSYIPLSYRVAREGIFPSSEEGDRPEEVKKDIDVLLQKTLQDDEMIDKACYGMQVTVTAKREDEKFIPITLRDEIDVMDSEFLTIYTVAQYNMIAPRPIELREGEIGFQAGHTMKEIKEDISFLGKDLRVRQIDDAPKFNRIMNESSVIIVSSVEEVKEFASYYKFPNREAGEEIENQMEYVFMWNVKNGSEDYSERAKAIFEQEGLSFVTQRGSVADAYSLNGGFVLLGLIIGSVFLIAVVLVLYYKQISEGYEDRRAYQIMKKVGLSDEMIKQTTDQQLLWLFFLPLFVAGIHMAGAFKILFQLLGLFGITKMNGFLTNILIIMAIFAISYFAVYKITSKVYREIVQ
ncbi:MAG: hypothetical protein Q4A75_02760 [Peptostreptococcaceae bacterium]|nr:hypothetical protein [Peptostreptococcaceae bacterium]